MSKLSRAEKIVQQCLKDDPESMDNRSILEMMQDCMAVNRIEREIDALSKPAGFNEGPRVKMTKLYDELDVILKKYGLPKSEDDDN